MTHSPPLRLDEPAMYHVLVQGVLPHHWSTHFAGLACTVRHTETTAVTLLHGRVADQSHLHGLLALLRDLNLPLLEVVWEGRAPQGN